MSSSKPEQNYNNHKQFVPIVHFFLMPLSLVTAIGSLVYAGLQIAGGNAVFASLLLLFLSIMMLLLILVSRSVGLKVQDRVIRTEEDLRHYKLTGRWIDPSLTIPQLIALRFASDEEFPPLCEQAVKENLKPDAIKRSIRSWRADHQRV
ncbi:DUF6526 family protein [Paenibacillus hexagrammi]|uniref:DUF6526 family protein n=1 Tax=Paenibacillus hexagrammi TaxID=2908839 RepID=A0ABY3SLI1_9BACL|nr:DUF6526 family protein [Paenibacillus sp. YPD9-1]UJF33931.1 DUF6526 family protein [Paenibacillus sp. YPD9-1]